MNHLRHLVSLIAVAVALPVAAAAQTVMGTLSTHDAQVNGAMQVRGERADLLSNDAITAFDHTAPIALTRGGQALVCSTSQFHLLRSGDASALLFALDRGALELHGLADPHDLVLTPDIRFAIESPGTYALSLRVTPNGDTCVDNAGSAAPVLLLTDAFSSTSYRLIPGQHVLFEHGSLREVVDNERSPCGCPTEPAAATPAEAAHPFPAAVSAGLVPAQPVGNSTPDGQTHTQIDANLSYSAGQPRPAIAAATAAAATPNPVAAPTSTEPPPTPPGAHDIAHAIGHFFHKLFHPGEKPSTPARSSSTDH